MSRPLRFVIVGCVGFAVDAVTLVVLLAATNGDPVLLRAFSIAVALTATWLLNRYLTFGPSGRPVAVEGARYGGVGITTAAVNYLIYSAVLLLFPATSPVAALVVGSVAAMILSYLGYGKLVFDKKADSTQ